MEKDNRQAKDYFEHDYDNNPDQGRDIPSPWRGFILIVVVLIVVSMFSGCTDDHRTDPIYVVDGEMLDDAKSWCFSNNGVDYFTMEDNDPELLVCKDGRVIDEIWYTP